MDSKKKYVRFMGTNELIKFLHGETLKNETDWSKQAKCTNSIGFCFFDDSVSPESRIEYLTGVVDMDFVAVFEPICPIQFKESEGMYRDPEKDVPHTLIEALFSAPILMKVKEYCLNEYNRNMLRLVKVRVPMMRLGNYYIDWDFVGRHKILSGLEKEADGLNCNLRREKVK